jgi:hypothetical protein
MSVLSVLNVLLTADGSKFDSAFAKSDKNANVFIGTMKRLDGTMKLVKAGAATLVAGLGFQALRSMTKDVLAGVEAHASFAKRIGVSYNALTVMQHAAEKNSSSADVMTASLGQMIHVIGEATSGSASAAATFKDLGLSAYKLRAMGAERAFTTITTAIRGMNDPMDRANAVQAIFGKGQYEIGNLLEVNAEKMAQYATEADKIGKLKSDGQVTDALGVKDAIDRIEGSVGRLKEALVITISPTLTSVLNEWAAALEHLNAGQPKGDPVAEAERAKRIVGQTEDGRDIMQPAFAPTFDPAAASAAKLARASGNPVYDAVTKKIGDGASRLGDFFKELAPKAYGGALMYDARESWSKVAGVGRAVGGFRRPIGEIVDRNLDKAAEDQARIKHELPGLVTRGSQADYQATARQRLAQLNGNEPKTKEEREKKQAQDVKRMVDLLGGIKTVLGEAPKVWKGDD